MDAFQSELQEMMRAAQNGGVREPGDDPFEKGTNPFDMPTKGQKPPGLEAYSHEEIMEMYKVLAEGKMPEQLADMTQNYCDKDGNPIIDEEGGAVIQPLAGFVVKTKDQTGQKIFVNMTHHAIVEGIEEKKITAEEAAKLGSSEQGVRIPLSLGNVREDSDKNGDPVQVYDIIWNTKVVEDA